MPRQPRQLSDTGIYHIMLRGINRQRIFEDDADYTYFLGCLRDVRDLSTSVILAYCCMPNHVHLLMEQGDEPVSTVMKRLGVRYATWFNRKYDRVGHLFQDRFLSRPVDSDPYLLMVVMYIHFNPVAAGICDQPTDYRWSSRFALGHPTSLIDLARLEQLLPTNAIAEAEDHYQPVPDPGDHLVGQSPDELHQTDDQAWQLVALASGTATGSEFQALALARQRAAVQTLRSWRVPIRQISRLTGLNRNLIYRWGVGVNESSDQTELSLAS